MRTEALNQSARPLRSAPRCQGGAGEQPDIEPRFEMAHGMAERRLRHAKLGRRAGKAAFTRHHHKGEQMTLHVLF